MTARQWRDVGVLTLAGLAVRLFFAPAPGHVLDIDVFDETSHAFDPDDLMQRAEVLNRTALSLFQNTLTPDYLRTMQVDVSSV